MMTDRIRNDDVSDRVRHCHYVGSVILNFSGECKNRGYVQIICSMITLNDPMFSRYES